MSEKTVQKDDLQKAINALADVAKGHSSRGTATTAVESMKDGSVGAAGVGGGTGTQVNHTANNSNRGSWAGSTWNGSAEDGVGADSIAENGTDYNEQGAVMKSIFEKIEKGEALSPAERLVFKSYMAKGKKPDFMDDKDDDKDMEKGKKPAFMEKDDEKDDDDDMDKSLSEYASENDDVSKGLEVSEFLAGFVDVVAKSLAASEARIVAKLSKQFLAEAEGTGEFQKSLAEAVVSLGESISAVAQRQEQIETQAARAPKSVQGLQAVEKSMGGNNGQRSEPLSKALVANTLASLAQDDSSGVSTRDVLLFDSTGDLPPHLEAKVRTAVGQ